MTSQEALIAEALQKLIATWRANAVSNREDGEAAERRQKWHAAAGSINYARKYPFAV